MTNEDTPLLSKERSEPAVEAFEESRVLDMESGEADALPVSVDGLPGQSQDGFPLAAREQDDAESGGSDVATFPDSPAESEEAADAPAGLRALGICLKKAGQVFFFPDQEHTVRIGSKVVVELEHGPALGEVESIVYGKIPAFSDDPAAFQGKVIGLATAQDIAQNTENAILSAEASAFCKTCIRQRGLDMKLVEVEVLHDRSKIIFYFTAPSRIDFRELVKDLVRNYRTRIELRQIGVRHETQMVGAIGNCGMVCCCHRYLRKFAPVTIKMAKEQNLFLNPAKLSGMCGRLLCCLSFEQGNYEEFNRRCPKLGKRYTTTNGTVKVLRANMFSQSIAVLAETGEEIELTLEAWDALEPRRAEPPAPEQQRTAAPRGERTFPQGRKGRGKEPGRKAAHADAWLDAQDSNDSPEPEEAAMARFAALQDPEQPQPERGRPSQHEHSSRPHKRQRHEDD